ncbi:hypothetical protein [Ruminococcus albus]|uniref:hypothetical protein n=1 Tax=Ruminococcus albus TaxID=1264 RepID=UPI0009452C7B|nr:hypothetical protein [Ruminococcus albus]
METEQEEAFREYLSRKEELDALIISELRKGYGLDESFDLCKRFELNKLLIHSGGALVFLSSTIMQRKDGQTGM